MEPTVESQRRAGFELAWIVTIAVLLCAGSIYWSVPDSLLSRLESAGRWNVNGILALVVVVPLGATAFAVRRYRDAVGAQRMLAHLSLHDPLTGLPNRRHLHEILPGVLHHARRHNTRNALFLVDLDGFEAVNDTHGHEVGDQLMRAVAARLRAEAGQGRFVARHGGDEFVILDPSQDTPEQGLRMARDLVKLMEVPFDLGQNRIAISASVGIAFGEAGTEPEALVRDAGTAMYEAKNFPDRAAVFDPSMRSRLTPANAERRLEEALTAGEFRLYFQPLVSLRDSRLLGVEGLLRWDHPDRGLLRPADFLTQLDETGLIVPVGRWVLGEACRQARSWADAAPEGSRPLRVSVNVSPRQLSQSDFIDVLTEAIDSNGIDPAQIYLELTETALVSDARMAWAALRAAHDVGVGLALDDFGTGFSSIGHLRSFDLELVKLDRSYVVGLGESAEGDAIVRHIVALARSLGIATLAEGVSEAVHVQRLLDVGCELGQGEYFADAQPSSVIDRLIARHGAGVTPDQSRLVESDPNPSGTVVVPDLRRAEVGTEPTR
jgi:diguanylate cyclase (GGDEF)-like protein